MTRRGRTGRRVRWVIATAALLWWTIAPIPAGAAHQQPAGEDRRTDERRRILEQVDTVGRRGFLFEVTSPAGPEPAGRAVAGVHRLFLYGTIHVGRVGSEPFNPPVVRALRAACRLALEADPTDASIALRLTTELGRYDDGDSLERHLTPALMDRVAAYGRKNGLAVPQLARFKPWLLTNMMTVRNFGAAGLDPALGSELYLSGFARARGMPVVEIEGMEMQLRLLAGLPDDLQAAQLDEALAATGGSPATGGAATHDAGDEEALFDVWLHGDAVAADDLVVQLHREAAERPFGRAFVETLIDARNRTMTARAEEELARAGPTFFAVGALHLFGTTGLVAELGRRGYRVVDLQDAAATRVRAADAPPPCATIEGPPK